MNKTTFMKIFAVVVAVLIVAAALGENILYLEKVRAEEKYLAASPASDEYNTLTESTQRWLTWERIEMYACPLAVFAFLLCTVIVCKSSVVKAALPLLAAYIVGALLVVVNTMREGYSLAAVYFLHLSEGLLAAFAAWLVCLVLSLVLFKRKDNKK